MSITDYIPTETRRWTKTARECYERNCICTNCMFKDFFSSENQQCMMKAVVLQLYKKFGKPKKLTIDDYLPIDKQKDF